MGFASQCSLNHAPFDKTPLPNVTEEREEGQLRERQVFTAVCVPSPRPDKTAKLMLHQPASQCPPGSFVTKVSAGPLEAQATSTCFSDPLNTKASMMPATQESTSL
jgi:hypothetical protein